MSISTALVAAVALLTVPGVDTVADPGARPDSRQPATVITDKVATPTNDGPTCRGLPAVLVQAGETYHGTYDDDVILVEGDGATVYGYEGDDLICATAADDEGSHIHGGADDDVILTISGSHIAWGEEGDDVILLNGNVNEAWGGPGDDHIHGGGSNQILAYGEDGHDIINGSPGDDWLGGYDGNDLILGWDGDDWIYGMAGDDDLRGGNGFDDIGAAEGDDTCIDFDDPVNGATIWPGECENVILTGGGGIGGLKS
ncbi:MAG: calcium-binding protein [Actinomycetota bacterium]